MSHVSIGTQCIWNFFKDIKFKWVNKRLLDTTHMHLFILQVSKISAYTDYAIYTISII